MAIEVTFLQEGKQDPSAIALRLADFIKAARQSLRMAIYDFHLSERVSAPIVAALLDRARAGVQVQLVYDAGKIGLGAWTPSTVPASPETAAFVRRLGAQIASRPITGGDPHQPRLMHHKYIVRDSTSLWTGSTNFTEDSWALQENNIVTIDSPELCRYYETDFNELWTTGDIGTSGLHDTGSVQVDGASVVVAFSPGEGRTIDHDIAHRITGVKQRIKMCSMLITSGGILGALADVLSHGRVREYGGICDRTQMESVKAQWRGTPAQWKIGAFESVAKGLAGKNSTPYQPGRRHDFMHNKVVLVDDTVITGSFNLSSSATQNAENVLMITDQALAEKYSAYIDELVGRYERL